MFTISRKDGSGTPRTVEADALLSACEDLSENGLHALDVVASRSEVTLADAVVTAVTEPKKNSTFENGDLVHDDEGKKRIEAQHSALRAAGVAVNAEEQLYATGTRMADVGYATQTQRKIDHDAMRPVQETAHALIRAVRAEDRHDQVVTAREIADSLHVNGSISCLGGHVLSEHAIRGLSARLESPMLGYVLGLRDRMVTRKASGADVAEIKKANDADRANMADVLRHELMSAPGETVKLRMRTRGNNGKPDVYAVVSEGYTPADAPEAIGQIVDSLPSDARGSFAYDVVSTSWELRASVWTPTPVAEQAVGEAFEGYVSFRSKDNGTSRFNGGGGVTLLRCLNASTYTANGTSVSRVHRGRVLYDISAMLKGAMSAIDALCAAWGRNRAEEIAFPERVTIEDAIPGFWAYCLKDRRSELAGVLPGKTREHVDGLTCAFFQERREPARLVRSDLAQGWTRYIQDQPTDIRRDAEAAIGDWLVARKPIRCELKEVATV